MALFAGNNNKQQNQKNVNTRGVQLFNSQGERAKSTLIIGFWNEMLSLKMHPKLDESKVRDGQQFDYEQSISTSLTINNISTLVEGIEEEIIPNIKDHKTCGIGVVIGGNSVVKVGNRIGSEGQVITYLGIYKEIDEATLKPKTQIEYEFNTTNTLKDYDETTGKFDAGKCHSEIKTFLDVLKAARIAMSHAVAHSIRNNDYYTKQRETKMITDIAEKVGVPVQRSWDNKGGNSQGNVFTPKSTPAQSSQPEEVAEETMSYNDLPF